MYYAVSDLNGQRARRARLAGMRRNRMTETDRKRIKLMDEYDFYPEKNDDGEYVLKACKKNEEQQ